MFNYRKNIRKFPAFKRKALCLVVGIRLSKVELDHKLDHTTLLSLKTTLQYSSKTGTFVSFQTFNLSDNSLNTFSSPLCHLEFVLVALPASDVTYVR